MICLDFFNVNLRRGLRSDLKSLKNGLEAFVQITGFQRGEDKLISGDLGLSHAHIAEKGIVVLGDKRLAMLLAEL